MCALLFAAGCKNGTVEPDNTPEDPDDLSVNLTVRLSTAAKEIIADIAWTGQDLITVTTNTADGAAGTLNITGSNGSFTGILPEGCSLGSWAFYPAWDGTATSPCFMEILPDGKNYNIRLRESISPDQNKPLRAIPLSGIISHGNTDLDLATGVLKITVEYIPSSARALYLEAPEGTALSGIFQLSANGTALSSAAVTSSPRKSISFTPEKEAETRDFYIPLPIGTIPAGLKVSLLTGSGALELVTTSTENKIKAGEITLTEKLTWKEPDYPDDPDDPVGPDDPEDPRDPEGSQIDDLDEPKYYDWEW